jgi:serine/threonine protein kinase
VKLVGTGLGRPLSVEAVLKGGAPVAAAYLAPEQAWDPRAGDVRADVYALGCVLYHALTGRPPFPSTSSLLQAVKHATEPPRPARELNPAVPDGLQQILDWMMAKDPSRRYQTPGRAAQALLTFLLSCAEAEALPGGILSSPPLAEVPAPTREEGSPDETARAVAPGPLPGPLPPASAGRAFSRRDCLALVIGAGGLLCTQAAGWLLARHLRRRSPGPR